MAISNENLGLAGEFRVASELLKRVLFAGWPGKWARQMVAPQRRARNLEWAVTAWNSEVNGWSVAT